MCVALLLGGSGLVGVRRHGLSGGAGFGFALVDIGEVGGVAVGVEVTLAVDLNLLAVAVAAGDEAFDLGVVLGFGPGGDVGHGDFLPVVDVGGGDVGVTDVRIVVRADAVEDELVAVGVEVVRVVLVVVGLFRIVGVLWCCYCYIFRCSGGKDVVGDACVCVGMEGDGDCRGVGGVGDGFC